MKISAVICEFNPLHNGHKYLLSLTRRQGSDARTVCVMSGSFTQRGDVCRTDKYLRAQHAVLCGADAVVELPAPFAVAPAEIFARGAVKTLSYIDGETTLFFGVESGTSEDFIRAADILLNENETFKEELDRGLDSGESYIRSYCSAFEKCGGNGKLLSSPNNILGVEYVKAMKAAGLGFTFSPVERRGAGYNQTELKGEFFSSGGIRENADNPKIAQAMPVCSYDDFIRSADNRAAFEKLAADWLYMCDKQNLKRVFGCSEGLENRLKVLSELHSYDEIISLASSKRYSKTRIKRVLATNLLGLYADETLSFLDCPLKPKVLAIKKDCADELLPLLSSRTAEDGGKNAEKCAELTSRAYGLWRHLSSPLICDNPNEKTIFI